MLNARTLYLASIAMCLSGALLQAMFVRPDLENVPISRITANLERLIAENPNDVMLRINLARTHAMAYAQKTEEARIRKGGEKYGPDNGHAPVYEPFKVKPAPNDAARLAAETHLKAAIAEYQNVVRLAPRDLTAHLGLGWALDQAGQKEQAIAEYRRVVREGFATDGRERGPNAPGTFMGQRYRSEEAAHYLIPLLDPVADRDEIADLTTKIKELERRPRAITPIAIPLEDGLSVQDVANPMARVTFDADGSGFRRPWTWIRPNAAWLVFDKRGTRQVTSSLQLFGNVTFWLFWRNGYDALRSLDDNGDARISGPELSGLALWRDENANGISDAGEVRPLTDWKIVSLSCDYDFDTTHPDEIPFSASGVTFANGTVRPTWDVVLHRR